MRSRAGDGCRCRARARRGTRRRKPRFRASWREGRTSVGRRGPTRPRPRSRTGHREPILTSMAHTRWVHLTRAASAAGLAVFAAYTLLATPADAYFSFFNTWVYD